jgi:aminomethyltransferase
MTNTIKHTPLHAWHQNQGARMAEFAGYQMPLWYSSVKQEHLTVLTHAGLFDTSHMAAVWVEGPQAVDLLQVCFTKDLSACIGVPPQELPLGRSVYGAFLNPAGEVIDDAIIFRTAAEQYLTVVNAGMGPPIAAHLRTHRASRDVDIVDLTDALGKIDLQGPAAAKIMHQVLSDPAQVLDRLVYFSFKGQIPGYATAMPEVILADGTPLMISRTGYTGEFGFEIFTRPEDATHVWETVLQAGEAHGVRPCGLASRDSLRCGAVLPLSHQDIGPWPYINHPWTFSLPYTTDRTGFTKAFIGDQALLNVPNPQYTYPFMGRDLRKVSTEDGARAVDAAGHDIGQVLSCTSDMGIGRADGRVYSIASGDRPQDFVPRGLSCGFVKVNRPMPYGEKISIQDKRRTLPVTIVEDIRPDRTARYAMQKMI